MIKALFSAAAFTAAFFLSGCTTTVSLVPEEECQVEIVEKPEAPEPVAIRWQMAHGIFYTDEDNFELYVRNLEKIIAYTADLNAQLDYYIDATEACQDGEDK